MSTNKIVPVPDLPEGIKKAVNDGNLVVFIGAGVSRLLGCQGWGELASNLVNKCFETEASDGNNCITYKEKVKLEGIHDHKKIISICYSILSNSGNQEAFYEEFNKALEPDPQRLKDFNIYNEIARFRGICVTTNADTCFDNNFLPTKLLFRINDFDPSTIERNTLYHIHGLKGHRDSLIFTVRKYIERYQEPQFIKFMERLFSGKYVILFIGYGMSEFELLDYIIGKFISDEGDVLRHFTLRPYYRSEEKFLEYERNYFNELGIRVMPYAKDEIGYDQLYFVLKNWQKEINQTSTYLSNSYDKLEQAANNYDKDKEDDIFQAIKNDKPLENYFFRCLSSSKNPIPWLEPLEKHGYLDPENNPTPEKLPEQNGFTIPYWRVLGYLDNLASYNEKNPSDSIIESLITIIDNVSNFKNAGGERIKNSNTDSVLVEILSKLPLDKVTIDHVVFIKTALEEDHRPSLITTTLRKEFLPKVIDEGSKRLLPLLLNNVIFEYKKISKKGSEKYQPLMNKYPLRETLEEYKSSIAYICRRQASRIALKKMAQITNQDKQHFDNIWIPTIEDHPQTSFPKRYECQLTHFIRDMFEMNDPEINKKQIRALTKGNHPIFRRISLHVINYHYEQLNEIFWNWSGNPLDDNLLTHELYELMKDRCTCFSKAQIDQILEWIEAKHYSISDYSEIDKKDMEKGIAYRKKEWLSALLETGDPDVINAYKKYNSINPLELKHPGFISWMGTGSERKSSIKVDELVNKSNEAIAMSLKERTSGGGLSVNPRTFEKCVRGKPTKFANNLDPFLASHAIFTNALLSGLRTAWQDQKNFSWSNVFDFILTLIETEEFWNESPRKEKDSYVQSWVISSIADLINEGIKDDEHTFNPDLLPKAERILLTLAERDRSELPDAHDLVTSVLNSAKGKIFSAMVAYSLHYARLISEEAEGKWNESIKNYFTSRLKRRGDCSLEFSVSLGKYLANLSYLDNSWVLDNINKIFPKEVEQHWEAAFTGYLFYSTKIYKNIFLLLKKQGHYANAIQHEFYSDLINNRLVQHICVAYIHQIEKIEESSSLINQLLNNRRCDHLTETIRFFWSKRKDRNNILKERIKPLWKKIYKIAQRQDDNEKYQEILSQLSKWLTLIDEIDEDMLEWLKESAKYINLGSNTRFFIDGLLEHVTKTPNKVGEIYRVMISENTLPLYYLEEVKNTVEILYEQDQKEIADRICNFYLGKGIDFLKDIYDKYQVSTSK